MSKHPMQPLQYDDDSVVTFKINKIVRFLLDGGPFDLNKLAAMPFSNEDRTQLAQLIGYPVDGFCELSYVDKETLEEADDSAKKFRSKHHAKEATNTDNG